MKKTIKRILITLLVIGVTGGGLYGGYAYRQSKKTAKVVLASSVGQTEYWMDNVESYGQVTSDKSQMGYLPKHAEVLSLNVKEGDHVEAGDVILSVKNDKKDINSKRLEIEKATQALNVEKIKLDRLLKTKPAPTYVYSQDVYKTLTFIQSKKYKVAAEDGFDYDRTQSHYDKDKDIVAEEFFDAEGKSTGMTAYRKSGVMDSDNKQKLDAITLTEDEAKYIREQASEGILYTEDVEGSSEYIRSTTYFDAETSAVVGEIVYTPTGEVESEKKQPTGMNAQELQDAIADEEATIKQQDLALRKLQYEYETIENTSSEGAVLAKVSGTVSKLQSIDNYNTNQPFFVINATDDYYITGAIGEFYLDQINIGDTVSINCWDNGKSADAVVTYVSDTPSKDSTGFFGGGNSNISNYEFKASFDRNSGIDIGAAVDITFASNEEGEKGLYLPTYLVKKDATGSYVMKMNKKGLLKKKYVTVGKTVYGSMIQIKKGVSVEDYLAFPYGTGSKEGIKCEKVDSLDYEEGGLG